MLSVRAHPDDWDFCINKLACYQISITLMYNLVLESASLPQYLIPPKVFFNICFVCKF